MERLFTRAAQSQVRGPAMDRHEVFSYPRLTECCSLQPTQHARYSPVRTESWAGQPFTSHVWTKGDRRSHTPTFRPFTGGQLMVAWSLTTWGARYERCRRKNIVIIGAVYLDELIARLSRPCSFTRHDGLPKFDQQMFRPFCAPTSNRIPNKIRSLFECEIDFRYSILHRVCHLVRAAILFVRAAGAGCKLYHPPT